MENGVHNPKVGCYVFCRVVVKNELVPFHMGSFHNNIILVLFLCEGGYENIPRFQREFLGRSAIAEIESWENEVRVMVRHGSAWGDCGIRGGEFNFRHI
jgi:hypothetical protein